MVSKLGPEQENCSKKGLPSVVSYFSMGLYFPDYTVNCLSPGVSTDGFLKKRIKPRVKWEKSSSTESSKKHGLIVFGKNLKTTSWYEHEC